MNIDTQMNEAHQDDEPVEASKPITKRVFVNRAPVILTDGNIPIGMEWTLVGITNTNIMLSFTIMGHSKSFEFSPELVNMVFESKTVEVTE